MKMVNYSINPATSEEVAYVSSHIRESDREEIKATYGVGINVGVVVRRGWRVSRDTSFVGKADGEPMCLFGLKTPTMLNNVAVPWLISTLTLPMHSRRFLRISRRIVGVWARDYPILENYVDARNTDAVHWLQWLGFSVYYPQLRGVENMPFHRFDMRA